jgi:hypothetical protein
MVRESEMVKQEAPFARNGARSKKEAPLARSARRAHHIRSARRTSLDEDVRRPDRTGRPRRKLSTMLWCSACSQSMFGEFGHVHVAT